MNLPGNPKIVTLIFAALLLAATSTKSFGDDRLLMTLSVDSATVNWQDEFVLKLEVYGPAGLAEPQVTIAGLDQFKLRSQGKNLLEVPHGKTVKWILTYNLTATQDGTFKLGPAEATIEGKRYSSNTLFITVQGTEQPQPRVSEIPTPVVHSASEVGKSVLILMDTDKAKPYENEATTVTLKLLSRLPVENLKFDQEADFPGFLKYDFPISESPRGQKVHYENETYVSYELQKFLVFPIHPGVYTLPTVRCELEVRVPSGAYEAADLQLHLTRESNPVHLEVQPVPVKNAVVGHFTLQDKLLIDTDDTKVLQLTLEGEGQLSTFEFPLPAAESVQTRILSTDTDASIRNGNLVSRKSTRIEITPLDNRTMNVLLQPGSIPRFDPETRRASTLTLSPLSLRFTARPVIPPPPPPVPDVADSILLALWVAAALTTIATLIRASLRRPVKPVAPRLSRLIQRKNLSLQISRQAAQNLYQKMMLAITEHDGDNASLILTLKRHLPSEEWMDAEHAFRRLEWNAFSLARPRSLTHKEMQRVCKKVEARWQP